MTYHVNKASILKMLLVNSVCIFMFCLYAGVDGNDIPFNNVLLSWKERVDDLVQRLTIGEIVQQMAHGHSQSPAIPRFGIKPYSWGSECLRGDVGAGPATSFPQALGLSATFRFVQLFTKRCSV